MLKIRSYFIVYSSFFIALVFSTFPLPIFLNILRPELVLMVLFYWTLALPDKIGSFHALFVGLILDLLLGSTIGLHALLLPFFSYFVAINYQKIRCFSLAKMTILVGFTVFINKLALYLIASTQHDIVLHLYYFFGVIVSMILWPWFFILMRVIREKFKVSE